MRLLHRAAALHVHHYFSDASTWKFFSLIYFSKVGRTRNLVQMLQPMTYRTFLAIKLVNGPQRWNPNPSESLAHKQAHLVDGQKGIVFNHKYIDDRIYLLDCMWSIWRWNWILILVNDETIWDGDSGPFEFLRWIPLIDLRCEIFFWSQDPWPSGICPRGPWHKCCNQDSVNTSLKPLFF